MTVSAIEQLGGNSGSTAGRGPWRRAWSSFVRKKLAMASLVFIVLVYTAGIFAPFVAPYGFNQQNLDAALRPPSLEYPFGTDRVGRDQLSRIIWGARTAAIVSFLSVLFGGLFGVLVGLVAGYYRGWVDAVVQRVSDLIFAFPEILLVILFAGTVRPRVLDWVRGLEDAWDFRGLVQSGIVDYLVVFSALSIVAWPGLARFIRGQLLALRERDFVEAARATGASGTRIMFRHLFPNTAPFLVVLFSAALGGAVTAEVGLSVLGIGIQPPNPSWGRMIFENLGTLRTPQWYLLVIPGVVVALFFIAFSLLGDGLNDALNPRRNSGQ